MSSGTGSRLLLWVRTPTENVIQFRSVSHKFETSGIRALLIYEVALMCSLLMSEGEESC